MMWETFALSAMQSAQSLWGLGTHLITDKPSFKDKGMSTFAWSNTSLWLLALVMENLAN